LEVRNGAAMLVSSQVHTQFMLASFA